MAPERWLQTILLFCIVFYTAVGAFVGINIGTNVSDLPKAIDIVAILKARQITHIRLFYTNTHMLNALLNTGIDVVVGVMNEEVPGIGESPSLAATWINKNIAAYVPSINITAIAVGNEILTSMPNGIPVVVTETGWPWLGGTNESDITIDNVEMYNNNLILRVLNGSGPPSQPTIPINAYIYKLFNDDMRPGPVSERNWGVLFTNSTTV